MKKKNIVLIGFRGSGKKVLGRALTEISHLPFADIESEIEFIIDEPISDFIKKYGWQVFREVEQRVTHDFCRNFLGILATGSGTIENSKNLQNLKKTGTFIWLNTDFEEIKTNLLKKGEEQKWPRLNPNVPFIEEISQMWQQRNGIYEAIAEIKIHSSLKTNIKNETQRVSDILQNILPPPLLPKRVAVLSSSHGTTFQGLLDAQKKGRIPNVTFSLFVTDTKDCEALKKAKKEKIENIQVVEPQKGSSREQYDREIMNIIRKDNPDMILLLGWMRILSPIFCEQFGNITLNVHPSLLPQFAGLKGDTIHQKVLEHEERYTGCTIHKVIAKVDAGETVLQRKVLIEEGDTVEKLQKKVQKQEILGFCEILEKR